MIIGEGQSGDEWQPVEPPEPCTGSEQPKHKELQNLRSVRVLFPPDDPKACERNREALQRIGGQMGGKRIGNVAVPADINDVEYMEGGLSELLTRINPEKYPPPPGLQKKKDSDEPLIS